MSAARSITLRIGGDHAAEAHAGDLQSGLAQDAIAQLRVSRSRTRMGRRAFVVRGRAGADAAAGTASPASRKLRRDESGIEYPPNQMLKSYFRPGATFMPTDFSRRLFLGGSGALLAHGLLARPCPYGRGGVAAARSRFPWSRATTAARMRTTRWPPSTTRSGRCCGARSTW